MVTKTKKKKVITFSLWGNNPRYTVGAIKNADLAAQMRADVEQEA